MEIYSEHQKAEASFDINSFGKPMEFSGVEAWARQIIRLMFMEPGTYPSDPKMGCDISAETYEDIAALKSLVARNVDTQVRKYFPDIPYKATNVFSEDELVSGGNPGVVYYIMAFQENYEETVTVKVASRVVNNIIDFEIKF